MNDRARWRDVPAMMVGIWRDRRAARRLRARAAATRAQAERVELEAARIVAQTERLAHRRMRGRMRPRR